MTAATAKKAGFDNWEKVSAYIPDTDKLFRSGAPHYGETHIHDGHRLDNTAIDFLKASGIKHVISLNSRAKSDTEIKRALDEAKIAYTPLPVKDFDPPNSDQFLSGNEAYKKHRDGTLVWCGAGFGRTGTMITALQIYAIKDGNLAVRLGRKDYDKNHVERDGQREALDKLQDSLEL